MVKKQRIYKRTEVTCISHRIC